jgi:hypothetical protein
VLMSRRRRSLARLPAGQKNVDFSVEPAYLFRNGRDLRQLALVAISCDEGICVRFYNKKCPYFPLAGRDQLSHWNR